MFRDKNPENERRSDPPDSERRPEFQTPSYTTAMEPVEEITLSDESGDGRGRLRSWWGGLNRNARFGILSLAVLIAIGGAIGIYNFTKPSSQTDISISKNKKAKTTGASPLSGVEVELPLTQRPVTAVMIENSPDARPQSGVQDAGVIFEAIAEGGITRFLSLYQEGQPSYIGPVRSLRSYYIDWATPFDASIAHVGGSPDALSQIRSGGKDLDQFFNAGSYWRQTNRIAPHNVYTSFEKMDALNKSKGYNSSKVQSWPRKIDQPLAAPIAKSIDINISSSLFNSHYDYDAASNTYFRSEGGQKHYVITSAQDSPGTQLHPKTIIALVMSYGIESDGQHSFYSTTGAGDVLVFQDGYVTKGRWYKPDRATQYKFTDANGATIKLNAGQTWVVAVQDSTRASYN